MPSSTSSASIYSKSSSSTDSSFIYSTSKPRADETEVKSSLRKVLDKARGKLAENKAHYEREVAKDLEKERRRELYERLGLGNRSKFGQLGAGGWNA